MFTALGIYLRLVLVLATRIAPRMAHNIMHKWRNEITGI